VEGFNTRLPAPKPGSTKAITQRKAIADGYEAAPTKRVVDAHMADTKTGSTYVPGFSGKR
jgi:hypothetical protein